MNQLLTLSSNERQEAPQQEYTNEEQRRRNVKTAWANKIIKSCEEYGTIQLRLVYIHNVFLLTSQMFA